MFNIGSTVFYESHPSVVVGMTESETGTVYYLNSFTPEGVTVHANVPEDQLLTSLPAPAQPVPEESMASDVQEAAEVQTSKKKK